MSRFLEMDFSNGLIPFGRGVKFKHVVDVFDVFNVVVMVVSLLALSHVTELKL